uniref:Uncharacterized protein n=1 Tax=Acinetobacter nosocomialis TaxID=106654 RepID=A0A7S9DQC7_ACINO|nr:hypothetical protein WM98B_00078 [Acinetobacter nosocomialis]
MRSRGYIDSPPFILYVCERGARRSVDLWTVRYPILPELALKYIRALDQLKPGHPIFEPTLSLKQAR